MHELDYWDHASFITLTYRDEDLPANASLDKPELQRFLKRLRKSLENRPIKYYASGEYGENTQRPHYHAIIFGLAPLLGDQALIERAWPHGNVFTGSVTYNSARYVAGYIGKKKYGELAEKEYGDRKPPFQIQSRGIGERFLQDNKERILEDLELTLYGKQCGIPRYYKKLLTETENQRLELALRLQKESKKRREELADEYRKKGVEDEDIYRDVKRALRQHDKNLKAKEDIKNSNTQRRRI